MKSNILRKIFIVVIATTIVIVLLILLAPKDNQLSWLSFKNITNDNSKNEDITKSTYFYDEEIINNIKNRKDDGIEFYEVSYKNSQFNPQKIVIQAGDTINFANYDNRELLITGTDWVEDNLLKNNETFTKTFKIRGLYSYYLKDQPEISGVIVVE